MADVTYIRLRKEFIYSSSNNGFFYAVHPGLASVPKPGKAPVDDSGLEEGVGNGLGSIILIRGWNSQQRPTSSC